MKIVYRLLLLIIPFACMVLVNSTHDPVIVGEVFVLQGVPARNDATYVKTRCSWVCHNDTAYCMEHHSSWAKPILPLTNLLYFGLIALMSIGGAYGAITLLLLVVVAPLTLWWLLVRVTSLFQEVRALTRETRPSR